MAKISVIVPVYKVEQYLVQCIESIVAQTHPNLEIILVDDGSPDECGAICDAWKEKDARICVIHTENKGLSCARNTGLDHATGDYIMFVDSDDYIAPQMAARLLQQLEHDQSDVAVCDFFRLYEVGELPQKKLDKSRAVFDACLDTDQALRLLDVRGSAYIPAAWNKLYRKQVFDHIRFPEGKVFEDTFILHHVYGTSTRVSFLSDKLYYYRRRENSIMTQPYSVHRLDGAENYYQRAIFMQERGYFDLAIDSLRQVQQILMGARKFLNKQDAQALIQSYDIKCRKIFFACFWKKQNWESRCATTLYTIHPMIYRVVRHVVKRAERCLDYIRTTIQSTQKEPL